MNTQIAAIVPTFNAVSKVEKAIKSLLSQTTKLKQLIVIDNGSGDSTSTKLKKKFGRQITLVTLKSNTGVSGGRNTGIKYLKKDVNFVLFFDHDMIAEKRMIENLYQIINSNREIGIVTPKIFYLSNKKIIWSAGTAMNLMTGQVLFRGGEDRGQYNLDEEVAVAPAVMLMKKEVLKKIKGFDERYFATFEDTDFCFRARAKGYKTFFSPKAVAYHDLPLDKDGESRRLVNRLYWIGRNRILFMKDFGSPLFWFFLPVFLIYYLRLSLKYGSIKNWFSFIKGTIDGLLA